MSFMAGYLDAKDRKARHEQLAQQKKIQDTELFARGIIPDEQGGFTVRPNSPASVEEQENSLLEQQLQMVQQAVKAMQGRNDADATTNALLKFSSSGDANVFQQALNKSPTLKQAWMDRGVQTITNVDFENDKVLLRKAGITEEQQNNKEVREALKRQVWKYYDGEKWNLGSVNNLLAETGLQRHLSQQEMDMHIEQANTLTGLLQGRLPGQGESELDRKKFELDAEEHKLNKEKFEHRKENPSGGSLTFRAKDAEKINENLDKMRASFPDQDIMSVDFSDFKNREKIADEVVQYEHFSKNRPSSADKKKYSEIRKLILLADKGKDITPQETGFINHTFKKVSKFISDNYEGQEEMSAVQAFQNVVRNSLFGAQLTKHESQNFKKQFGTLNQQQGPLLAQMITALTNIQADIEVAQETGHPIITSYYLGSSPEKLANIQENIRTQLDELFITKQNFDDVPEVLSSEDEEILGEILREM